MKTKINLYITLALLFVVGASCSDDFLEEKKNYGLYDDSFYESEERVEWYINGLYYRFFAGYTSPLENLTGSYTDLYSRWTEERGGMESGDFVNPNYTYVEAGDGSGYYGSKLEEKVKNEPYHRIRDINSFLQDIDTKGSGLDETYRDQAKGQMYYLRALQYFDLMRIYGGVPIVTTVQEASSTDTSIQLPRAAVSEVVAQIVEDLDLAASLLPGNWDASEYGRFTRGAALAQKARVLLTFASPLFNRNWDTSTERWDAALAAGLAAETQLTADGYGLYGASAKDWADMFLIDNAFCSEAIVVQLLSGATTGAIPNGWENGLRLISQGGGGGFAAPKEMIDLFPMANGTKPTTANGYDELLFFKDRDPRFYRTFAFSGSKWGYAENTSAVTWAYRWLDSDDNAYYSDNNEESSPAFVRKMSNPGATNTGYQYSGTDIFEYRYAELLLNIAEAYAAKGDVPNAIAYIGRVRNRVEIPSTNNYGLGSLSNKYEAIKACLYERQVELAYEGKRYWDAQRWMLYNDDTSLVQNTTCAALGLTPINGTQRTGKYLQYATVATSDDPLAAERASISVDPDAADFDTQIDALATLYSANFQLVDLNTPMDNDGSGNALTILWRPNYYVNGLNSGVLTQNTWLRQTIGWEDTSGTLGTYNYQE
ncbi:MAG: RagB/SusD family nutrient uptake outer membrane protein [Flavobacteriaceae bacterium]